MRARARKPDTRTAMIQLIQRIRAALPFGSDAAGLCRGDCRGCALKLLEFLDSACLDWETRLARGERPNLGDLHHLGRSARKVQAVLRRNGLVD